ncbi:MAG: hypothetical protein WAO77_09950 [Sphingobium sp.]|uniref:Bbp19 family protein n=1 Tax=Sphingobium sp. TaxID=1912891 RepID=UPI003BB0A1CA
MPSISAELLAIQQAAEGQSAKAQRHAREQIGIYQAYQQLFFEDGQLREAARIVLDDLTFEAALGFASPTFDYAELAAKEGKRRLLLHIFARFQLSPARARELERQLIQEEDT